MVTELVPPLTEATEATVLAAAAAAAATAAALANGGNVYVELYEVTSLQNGYLKLLEI